jgi:hypothetical protein
MDGKGSGIAGQRSVFRDQDLSGISRIKEIKKPGTRRFNGSPMAGSSFYYDNRNAEKLSKGNLRD